MGLLSPDSGNGLDKLEIPAQSFDQTEQNEQNESRVD